MYENIVNRSHYSFLSSNDMKECSELTVIKDMLSDFVENNFIELGTGYCIGVSDMVVTSLKHRGIKSKMVEVTLTYSLNRPDGGLFTDFVGFNHNAGSPGKIDTHVVVITETEVPYVIDASIQNRLPPGKHVVLDELKENGIDKILMDVSHPEFNNLRLTYKLKDEPRVAVVYQKSIIDRMNTDRKIFNDMKLLKRLNIIGISLSVFSVIAVVNQIMRWWH